MANRNEREILLAAASPREWKEWLRKVEEKLRSASSPYGCLFCKAYGFDTIPIKSYASSCGRCMPEAYEKHPGPGPCVGRYYGHTLATKVKAAKQRLKDAGIWED